MGLDLGDQAVSLAVTFDVEVDGVDSEPEAGGDAGPLSRSGWGDAVLG